MFTEGDTIIFIYLCIPTSRLHAEEYGGGGYKHVSSTFRNKEHYPMWLIQLPIFSEHAYLSTEMPALNDSTQFYVYVLTRMYSIAT